MEARAPSLPVAPAPRASLVRRARFLARLGLAWHAIEAAVAIVGGIAASSIALIGFGADRWSSPSLGSSCSGGWVNGALIPSKPRKERSA